MNPLSKKSGKNFSGCEVSAITPHGLWMLIHDKEYFLDFSTYPWFKKKNLEDIFEVILEHDHLVHWPKLDIDLSLEILEAPQRFPLLAKSRQ